MRITSMEIRTQNNRGESVVFEQDFNYLGAQTRQQIELVLSRWLDMVFADEKGSVDEGQKI